MAVAIALTSAERRGLEFLVRARKTGQAMARRARIVLAAAAGLENKTICAEVEADANTVSKWRRRFAEHRLDGLLDEPRPGTPRRIGDDEIADTVRRTLETAPPGATHWSLRSMAAAVGYAPSTIHRIWQAFGLPPHRSETFKLSTDPLFVEKVRDFALLTPRQLRRGVHRSTAQLEADIRAFIEAHNASPKPFRWTKSADDILPAIQRFCLRSRQIRETSRSGR